MREEPITREAVGRALLAAVRERSEKRARELPDDASAILAQFNANQRLRELGWRDAMYAPKDGSPLELIEVGSTGIHRGYRDEFGFWIIDPNDTSPSRPVLFRPATPTRPAEGADRPEGAV